MDQRGDIGKMNKRTSCNEKVNKGISYLFKGMIIGATMLVPGVSGGTMAIILGIYDKMISAVSSFMKDKKGNFIILSLCAAGGCLGMFLFSKPLMLVIETYPMPSMYFFMGAVVGSIPLIFRMSKLEKFSVRGLFYVLIGAAFVLALAYIPVDTGESAARGGMEGSIFLLAAGLAAAAALILPGISVSFVLLVIGLYDETVAAISHMYMPYLIPLGAGLIIGILLIAGILERAMDAYPQPTCLIILGFVLGSITEVFPGVPTGLELLLCILTFAMGAGCIILLSNREVKNK